MSHFNLIDEKWIPVRLPDGSRDELGIRETLLRAKEITAIEDPSPLVVAALHRFLLAVLYRALEGPTDIDQAKTLFKDGFPQQKIIAYLDKWRNRFWLFDEKYPFYQIPAFEPKKWRAWTSLAVEFNADTAKVLFDHTIEESPGHISMAAASRWLLSTQTFSVSTGKSEISHTGTAPSAGFVMAIPFGINLFDTLCFCLIPQNKDVMIGDLPIWEKEPDTIEYLKSKVVVKDKKSGNNKDRTIERRATGIIDLYTWRTRTVLIKESTDCLVTELGFASGIGYAESINYDPMLSYEEKYVKDDENNQKIKKRFSVVFDDKGIWRDFDSLLPDDTHLAPRVIEHAIALTVNIRNRFPRGVIVLGQKYYPPRPNIAYWRKEYFELPGALHGDRNVRHEIHAILVEAEDTFNSLIETLELFANKALTHGDRKVENADKINFVKQLSAPDRYWSVLESRFHEILRDYTLDRDPDDIRCLWLQYVRSALSDAWNQHCASLASSDAWALRALMKSEGPVKRKLKELNDENRKNSPQEEKA